MYVAYIIHCTVFFFKFQCEKYLKKGGVGSEGRGGGKRMETHTQRRWDEEGGERERERV